MTTDAEDHPTWPHNRKVIRRAGLLRLIEENGGPWGLDLRGCQFIGEEEWLLPGYNPIDLSPPTLAPIAATCQERESDSGPRWQFGDAIDLRATLLTGADLSRAQLQQASITGAQLEGAYLQGADLQRADLTDAQLQDSYLGETQLQDAYLRGAHLQRADLSGTQLQGAKLWGVQLQGSALWRTHFGGAYLGSARLEQMDMYEVASLDGAHWHGAFLDHTRIRRQSLGRAIGDEIEAHKKRTAPAYSQANEAYLLLKNNFNQIGRYEDASWAYVKEQQMEKMAYHWEWRSHGWKIWRGWGSLLGWVRNWAYELATGYGERPWNPIMGGLLAILGFAGGFCATRAIASFWDALVYSIATFATFNLARPGLNPQGPGAEVASSFEAILGISVLALVVFTLGNRMSRG